MIWGIIRQPSGNNRTIEELKLVSSGFRGDDQTSNNRTIEELKPNTRTVPCAGAR